jgi:hypothetical protein
MNFYFDSLNCICSFYWPMVVSRLTSKDSQRKHELHYHDRHLGLDSRSRQCSRNFGVFLGLWKIMLRHFPQSLPRNFNTYCIIINIRIIISINSLRKVGLYTNTKIFSESRVQDISIVLINNIRICATYCTGFTVGIVAFEELHPSIDVGSV